MVINKKNSPLKKDKDWFMFAMGLSNHIFSDYIALRLNYQLEPLTLAMTNLVSMVEVVEKSLKLYLSINEKLDNSLSHYSSYYGHNIEKLRNKAADYNSVFEDKDIMEFTKPFDDKRGALFQHLRYGSQNTIEGFKTNLAELMPIVDKIFYNCILNLEENYKKMIINSSFLYLLIINSEMDQSRNKELLIRSVKYNNLYFDQFKEYSEMINKEQKQVLEKFKQANQSSERKNEG